MPFEIAKLKAPSVQIKELIEDMYAMTRHTRNELKTMVYWSIATHGHEWLRVFPLLRIFGGTNTGKTVTLHMVEDLCRARKSPTGDYITGALFVKIKGSTPSSVRTLISNAANTGDTCIYDEADNFPYEYFEGVYAKAGSQTYKLKQEKGTFELDHSINLWAPLAMNGREVLSDESYQNRTIEITTSYDERGARSLVYEEGQFSVYRQLCADIASEIDWEAIKPAMTRVLDVWAPLRAVAEHLNDEDFLVYLNEVVTQTIKDGLEGRADEGDHQVLNAIIKLAHDAVVNRGEPFPMELPFSTIGGEFHSHRGKSVNGLERWVWKQRRKVCL